MMATHYSSEIFSTGTRYNSLSPQRTHTPFKAAVCSSFFLPLQNLHTRKNKQYKRVFRSIFRLECNNKCSAFIINIESSFIFSINIYIFLQANIYCYPVQYAFRRTFFKIRSVCSKVISLMKDQSLSSTFKRSIFLQTKLANVPLNLHRYFSSYLFEGNNRV